VHEKKDIRSHTEHDDDDDDDDDDDRALEITASKFKLSIALLLPDHGLYIHI
jgi:hypothetical protein